VLPNGGDVVGNKYMLREGVPSRFRAFSDDLVVTGGVGRGPDPPRTHALRELE
jgi:hypothetical protein